MILLEACLLDLLHHHRATADVYKAHCRRCARENHGKETSFRSPEGVWAVFSAASLVSSHEQACFSCRFFGHRVAYAVVLLNWLITDLYCFCIWPCTENDQ